MASVRTAALPRRATPRLPEPARRFVSEHPAVLLAAALAVVWLALGPRTPDLAAQFYRVDLWAHGGFAVWDDNWYGGHHLPAYSLTFPPLAALIGLRLTGAAAAVLSTALFERLARDRWGARARLGACWFALAAIGDPVIGRLTFALGVTVALAAVLAATRRRFWIAAALAALCSATSPVAGMFLVLAGLAHLLATRRPRPMVSLALPALGVAAALSLLFPEGGSEPFANSAFVATIVLIAAVVALLPARERLLRVGGLLYLLAVSFSYLINTPMGSNVERFGVLFGGPLLACAWRPPSARRVLTLVALALACLGIVAWQVRGPVLEAAKGVEDPSVSYAYYASLVDWLDAHATGPLRLEVPFTRSHWDAALLAPRIPLARGWERQLDGSYDAIFYRPTLTPVAYWAWLRREAVSYVALPDALLDNSSKAEARVIRSAPAFLRLLWSGPHWKLFAVVDPQPLAQGPGSLVALGHASFTLRVRRPGTFLVRVHYTPYWSVRGVAGCVRAGRGGWTSVTLARAGLATVAARFSLAGALRDGARCGAG
jgi:hypothetical protein